MCVGTCDHFKNSMWCHSAMHWPNPYITCLSTKSGWDSMARWQRWFMSSCNIGNVFVFMRYSSKVSTCPGCNSKLWGLQKQLATLSDRKQMDGSSKQTVRWALPVFVCLFNGEIGRHHKLHGVIPNSLVRLNLHRNIIAVPEKQT